MSMEQEAVMRRSSKGLQGYMGPREIFTSTSGDMSFGQLDLDELITWGSSASSPQHTAGGGGSQSFVQPQYQPSKSTAVHMELQENSKIPTLNQPVDRSNSSNQERKQPPNSTSTTNNEQKNMQLGEMFLGSRERTSLNLAYESAGVILQSGGGTGNDEKVNAPRKDSSHTFVTVQGRVRAEDLDALVSSVEPTPLSEIRRKEELVKHQRETRLCSELPQPSAGNVGTSAESRMASSWNHPHQQTYYPYGRPYQLPIPAAPSPAPIPSAPVMQDAVKTAAALATCQHKGKQVLPRVPSSSSQAGSVGSPPLRPAGAPLPSPPQYSNGIPHHQQLKVPRQNSGSVALNGSRPSHPELVAMAPAPATPPFRHSKRAPHTPPEHAVTYKTTSGAVANAAKQRTQYGFGGNHKVPSVPEPPPNTRKRENFIGKVGPNGSGPGPGPGPPLGPQPPIPTSVSLPKLPYVPGGTSAGAAYERKKLRAKEARVKLNEAIEQLSVAITMAGNQSQRRQKHMGYISGSSPETRGNSLSIMEDCSKISSAAKKWDRPSFVATAASLIQALNAQCESLMKELGEMQQQSNVNGTMAEPEPTPSSPRHKREASPVDHETEIAAKRRRIEQAGINGTSTTAGGKGVEATTGEGDAATERKEIVCWRSTGASSKEAHPPHETNFAPHGTNFTPPMQLEHIFSDSCVAAAVASFLGPLALMRSMRVSKKWKNMGILNKDDVWLNLSMKRFGLFNVRQWQTRSDEDEGDQKASSMKLYRRLDAENVMPHCSLVGTSGLGETRMQGVVSAWAHLVQRSNGETLRSLERETGEAGNSNQHGKYVSTPVVELRIVVQNVGLEGSPVIIQDQNFAVDASTKRSRETMRMITWDDRFKLDVRNLDGTAYTSSRKQQCTGELCRLNLFETAMLTVFIHARGCSTISKFIQRSKHLTIMLTLEGTTVPLVIHFSSTTG